MVIKQKVNFSFSLGESIKVFNLKTEVSLASVLFFFVLKSWTPGCITTGSFFTFLSEVYSELSSRGGVSRSEMFSHSNKTNHIVACGNISKKKTKKKPKNKITTCNHINTFKSITINEIFKRCCFFNIPHFYPSDYITIFIILIWYSARCSDCLGIDIEATQGIDGENMFFLFRIYLPSWQKD